MKNLGVSICLFLLLPVLVYSQGESKTNDLEIFRAKLPKLHCNLFAKTPQSEFDKQLDLLKADAEKISKLEFALRLQTIITMMGDSHSRINFGKLLDKKKQYPLDILWLKDGFRVLLIEKTYEQVLGYKLVAINKIGMDEILKKCESIIVKDNDAIVRENVPAIIKSKELLDYLKITKEGVNIFSFAEGNKKIDLEIKTIEEFNKSKGVAVIKPAVQPLCSLNPRQLFWYKYIDDKNILYAQYNMCSGKELAEVYGPAGYAEKLPSFNAFSDSVINIINSKHPSKFVFDMRNNAGGSSLQGTLFVEKISRIDEINKTGKLFVVIGKKTFSSAILNTMDFKRMTKAIIVGEETSGSPNHFGQVKSDTLSSTGIIYSYSTKYFTRTGEGTTSILPDVRLEADINDYKNGIDPVMDYIYSYKEENQVK